MQAGWLDKHTSAAFEDWFNDPVSFDKAIEAATHLLERLRPAGDPEWTDKDLEYIELYENIGKKNVNECIQTLTGSAKQAWAEELKDVMEPLCDRSGRPIDTGWGLEAVISINPKGGRK